MNPCVCLGIWMCDGHLGCFYCVFLCVYVCPRVSFCFRQFCFPGLASGFLWCEILPLPELRVLLFPLSPSYFHSFIGDPVNFNRVAGIRVGTGLDTLLVATPLNKNVSFSSTNH